MSNIKQILDEAEKLEPIAEQNGTKVYGVDDYIKAVQGELADPTPDMGTRKVNPDGSIARSRAVAAVVNENKLYGNLGMVKKTPGQGSDELWIAPQAIQEDYEFVDNPQYVPHKVKVFVVKPNKERNDIYIDRVVMMDGAEARTKLVHTYNEDFMKTCLALINEQGQEITKEESPFN